MVERMLSGASGDFRRRCFRYFRCFRCYGFLTRSFGLSCRMNPSSIRCNRFPKSRNVIAESSILKEANSSVPAAPMIRISPEDCPMTRGRP